MAKYKMDVLDTLIVAKSAYPISDKIAETVI